MSSLRCRASGSKPRDELDTVICPDENRTISATSSLHALDESCMYVCKYVLNWMVVHCIPYKSQSPTANPKPGSATFDIQKHNARLTSPGKLCGLAQIQIPGHGLKKSVHVAFCLSAPPCKRAYRFELRELKDFIGKIGYRWALASKGDTHAHSRQRIL